MAILGFGTYLCEGCKHFNTDGNDGNHSYCVKQSFAGVGDQAIRYGEVCPFGFTFGIPRGYPVTHERNEKRAYEIKAMLENDKEYYAKLSGVTEI